MPAAAWIQLLSLAGLWSGAFLLTEILLAHVGPLTAAFGRVAFGALGLWAAIAAFRLPVPRGLRLWRDLAVMGLLNNALPFALICLGQTAIAGGMAAILNATTPIFTVILAHLVTDDERLTGTKALGVGLGFAGVVVLVGPGALAGAGAGSVGQALVLAAALSYACASLWGRRLRALPATGAAAGQLTCSTVLLAPVALLLEPADLAALPWQAWAAVAVQGLAVTAVAYVLYFRVLKLAGATNLMLVTLLMPPGAILLGWAFLGERLTAADLGGLALIGLGLAAIDGRLLRIAGRLARA